MFAKLFGVLSFDIEGFELPLGHLPMLAGAGHDDDDEDDEPPPPLFIMPKPASMFRAYSTSALFSLLSLFMVQLSSFLQFVVLIYLQNQFRI